MSDVNELLKSTQETEVVDNSVKSREIVDQKPEAFIPRELQSFLQKMEQSPTQTSVINDAGQTQLSPATPTSPKIVLPTTRQNFILGFKKKVNDVAHWLSIFLFREIKLKGNSVTFPKEYDS